MSASNPYAPPESTQANLDDEAWSIVYRSSDPGEVQQLADLLESEGLQARVRGGLTGASVGLGQHAVQRLLEVPTVDQAEAQELLQAYQASLPQVHDEEPKEEERPRKKAVIAALLPFLMPLLAGSPFYVGQNILGVVLSIAECAAFLSFSGLGYGVYTVLKVGESILSVRGVRAFNDGRRISQAQQLLNGVVLLLIAYAVSLGLNHLDAPVR